MTKKNDLHVLLYKKKAEGVKNCKPLLKIIPNFESDDLELTNNYLPPPSKIKSSQDSVNDMPKVTLIFSNPADGFAVAFLHKVKFEESKTYGYAFGHWKFNNPITGIPMMRPDSSSIYFIDKNNTMLEMDLSFLKKTPQDLKRLSEKDELFRPQVIMNLPAGNAHDLSIFRTSEMYLRPRDQKQKEDFKEKVGYKQKDDDNIVQSMWSKISRASNKKDDLATQDTSSSKSAKLSWWSRLFCCSKHQRDDSEPSGVLKEIEDDEYDRYYELASWKIAVVTQDDNKRLLTVSVWCLHENRWLYKVTVKTPFIFDLKLAVNPTEKTHMLGKSHTFGKDSFHLSYFTQSLESREEEEQKTSWKMYLNYDFSLESENFSPKLLPLLMYRQLFATEKEDQDQNKKVIQAYLNLVYPHKILNVRAMFSIFYSLNDPEIFTSFLNNIKLESIFYDCRFYEIFFQDSSQNEARQCIMEAIKDFYEDSKQNTMINPKEAEWFMSQNNRETMNNEHSRELFKFLLLCPINKTLTMQLGLVKDRSYNIDEVIAKSDKTDPLNTITKIAGIDKILQRSNKVSVKESSDEDMNVFEEFKNLKLKLASASDKDKDFVTFEVYRSLCRADMSARSQGCTNLFITIQRLSDDDIQNEMLPMIYYKWSSMFHMALVYSMLYWLMAIAAYIFFGFQTDHKGWGGLVCVLNILFFIYEVVNGLSLEAKEYLSDLWNIFDLLMLVFSFANVIVILNTDSPDLIYYAWLRVVTVTFLWVRAITWLRVFSATRYLIAMVLQVFLDMRAFLIVFIAAILGYTFIWRLSPLLQAEDGLVPDPGDFYPAMYKPVMLIFGNGPTNESETENFKYIRFSINALGNVILSFAFLNFLIAIISGTFETFNEQRDIADCKELLNMIIEFNAFAAKFAFTKPAPSFYLTLQPTATPDEGMQMVEDDIDKLNETVEQRYDSLEATLVDHINQRFESIDDQLKSSVKQFAAKMRQETSNLKAAYMVQAAK